MPLDPMFADAILGTFRNMATEIKEKGITGEDTDKMNAVLHRMEELVQKYDDMNEFNGMIMQENLYTKFSDYYGRILAKASSAQYQVDANNYDEAADKKLLNQTLDAYQQAIDRLRKAKKDTVKNVGEKASKVFLDDEALIAPIQKVIDLGRSGYSYAAFLRLMIENGMDKAMEGSTVSRDAILYSIDNYTAGKINPHYEARENEFLKVWDELAVKAKFNVPSLLKYGFACDEINLKFEPLIIRWDKIKHYWENLLTRLCDWSMAHMSFAHTIEPWSVAPNPRAAVQETLDCDPGKIEIILSQIKRYFNIEFHDIFKHETFVWDANWQHMWYSQEYVMFMRDEVFPYCKPGMVMPRELAAKMESIYKGHRLRNPEQIKINERYRDVHNKYFGEGTYEKKYGMPEPYECNADPWDLSKF